MSGILFLKFEEVILCWSEEEAGGWGSVLGETRSKIFATGYGVSIGLTLSPPMVILLVRKSVKKLDYHLNPVTLVLILKLSLSSFK